MEEQGVFFPVTEEVTVKTVYFLDFIGQKEVDN